MNKGLKISLGIILGLGIVASAAGLTYLLNDQVHDYVDNLVDKDGDDIKGVALVDVLELTEDQNAAQGIQTEADQQPVYRLNLKLDGVKDSVLTDGYLVTKITSGDKANAKLSRYDGSIWAYESITHQTGEEIWLTHDAFEKVGDHATYTIMTYWADHPSVFKNTTVKFEYKEGAATSEDSSSSEPTSEDSGSSSSSSSEDTTGA